MKIGWLGKHSGVSVYKVGSCGLICGYMVVKMGWRDLGLVASERSIMFWWGYLWTCGRGNGVVNVSGIMQKLPLDYTFLRIKREVLKRRSLRWLFMAEFSMKPRFFRFFSSFLRLFSRVISDEKSNWGESLSGFGKNFGGIAILFLSINRNYMRDITNEIRTIIAWIQWICKVFSLQKTANGEWTDYGACKRQKGNVRWEISSFFSSNQIW